MDNQNKNMTGYASIDKPWLKYYEGTKEETIRDDLTLYENFILSLEKITDENAFLYLGGKFGYRRLHNEIELAAGAFAKAGVGKGDIVACCLLSCPEAAVCLFALNKLGAAIMILDPRRGVREIKEWLAESNVKYMVITDVFYPNVSEILPELKLNKLVISPLGRSASTVVRQVLRFKMRKLSIPYCDDIIGFEDFLKSGRGVEIQTVGFSEFELAAITFSGGTTGTPKGIMLSNFGLDSVAICCERLTDSDQYIRSVSIVPIFAAYGLACGMYTTLCLHDEIVLLPKPDTDTIGKTVKKYKPNYLFMVPGYYEKLIESKEMQKADLSYLVSAFSGGDTMSAGLEEKLNAFLKEHGAKYKVAQGYGMSEMCSVETADVREFNKEGSVGVPVCYVTVSVFEPGTTNELKYGEEGEICVTGPSLMMGYLNNPELTEKTMILHPDGQKWIHSGDLGHMDEDGFLYITGRMKRTIPRPDGHKVSPVQLENVVSRVDNVLACACVGVKDGKSKEGLQPVIAVVMKDMSRKDDTFKAIAEVLKREIEVRSQPIDVYAVDELPIVGMGKIDYKKVADDYMVSKGIIGR